MVPSASDIRLDHGRRPNAAAFMALAFLPRGRAPAPFSVPGATASWKGMRPGDELRRSLGPASTPPARGFVHPVHLHAITLRLMMRLLTHPGFPIPIWRLMQVRNRIVQHRPARLDDRLDLSARIAAWRLVARGAKVDVAVETRSPEGPVLESTTAFYARGRFGTPLAAEPIPGPPEPPVDGAPFAPVPPAGAWAFGRLTGDYNPLHWWSRRARDAGFHGAFAHPHRVLVPVLDAIPGIDLSGPLQVDSWFRGPVYYDRLLTLSSRRDGAATSFALRVEGDPRPAIAGVVDS
jgi:acyl dehydratase